MLQMSSLPRKADSHLKVGLANTHLQVNNMVYVFGGQLVKDGSVSNELFWMTSERMEWHAQPTRGGTGACRQTWACGGVRP